MMSNEQNGIKQEGGTKRPHEKTAESEIDEPLKKRIRELEEKITSLTQQNQSLTQQNQQKQNTIQLLTQHNVTLLYQAQLAQQLSSQLQTQVRYCYVKCY
jgi:predicted RNase H-like nuclease (RuvC/YqgF family)